MKTTESDKMIKFSKTLREKVYDKGNIVCLEMQTEYKSAVERQRAASKGEFRRERRKHSKNVRRKVRNLDSPRSINKDNNEIR